MIENQPLIKLSNLNKTYILNDIHINALSNISLSIPSGQIIFVMGPSGSGKTTLLNLIGGIDSPSKGCIFINGEDISKFSEKQLTIYRKKTLSFVFQFYSLIPTLTAAENVELIMELVGINQKDTYQLAIEYLKMVGMEKRTNNFPSQLSGGERQRVAIARALAKKPDIMLIDEPTGQLDHETGDKIVSTIQSMAKKFNKTVILVTHDQDLRKYADRIIELRSGKIVSDDMV